MVVKSKRERQLEAEQKKAGDEEDLTQLKSGGLLKKILERGTDRFKPNGADIVTIHFSIRIKETGELRYTTQDLRKPRKIQLSYDEEFNIPIINRAMLSMQTGEKALFTCEPGLAWGNKGAPQFRVPGGQALLFEIHLVDFDIGEEITWDVDGSVLRSSQKLGNPKGRLPSDGSTIYMKITGWWLNDQYDNFRTGTKFLEAESYEYELGTATEFELPEGVDWGVRRMRQGEEALFKVARKWHYGKEGHKEFKVPPEKPLVLLISLLHVEHRKEAKSLDIPEKIEEAARLKEIGKKFYAEGKYRTALMKFDNMMDIIGAMVGGKEKKRRSKDEREADTVPNVADMDYTKRLKTLENQEIPEKEGNMDPKEAYDLMSGNPGDPTGLATAPVVDWGQYKDARDDLYVDGLLNMAMTFYRLNDALQCIKHCNKVLEMDTKNVKAIYRRAQAKELRNDLPEAVKDYKKVLRLDPSNASAAKQIIVCKEKLKSSDKTEKKTLSGMFDKIKKVDEENFRKEKEEQEEEEYRKEIPHIWHKMKAMREEKEKEAKFKKPTETF